MSSPAVTRKRSRADVDEDELSPKKGKTTTPLASIKKRKLNTNESSPAGGTVLTSLKRRVTGIFGWKAKQKDNLLAEEEDELASGVSLDTNDGKRGAPEKDVWDIEVSESEEDTGPKRRNGSERSRSTSTPMKAASHKGSAKSKDVSGVDELAEDIWEVPEEDASARRSARKYTSSVEKAKVYFAPVSDGKERPAVRSPGRPKKSRILKEAKKLSNKAVRERMMAAGSENEDEEEETGITTKTRKAGRSRREESPAHTAPQAAASTGRKRGRPRKVSIDISESARQVPKGILTPSKRKVGRPRKIVSFEEGEVNLGFKDLPEKTSKKATPGNEEEPEEEVESDEADDLACALCSGLDSKKKNPIIICERCDYSVHQKCYKLSVVPEGAWFCKGCESKTGSDVLFPQLDDDQDLAGSSKNLPDIEGFEEHLRRMQRTILDRLSGQKRISLKGYDNEMQKVHQVVEQTVLAGEGNSMLMIGARGCGKTTLVESVISDLSDQREKFHVVRLNGFIHTDDKLALKEIWRQLGREMELEDDIAGKTSNYADTLASLLALLSHPSELSEGQTNQTAKSVVFILDEFDLFTTHSRQTLLYNLFDIAQARKAPIVVLGLTARMDVVESLEKRVKSRFSHRYVHLSLPRSLPAFWEICKAGLTVDADELDSEGLDLGIAGQDEFVSYWQAMIEDLYNKDETFKHHIESQFYRTKSVPGFFTSCILPIANLSARNIPLTGKAFTSNYLSLSPPDSKLELLRGLSELELALIIAAARLDIILDTDTCNFAMAYDEYSSLISRYKIQTSSTGVTALGASAKVWGRDVALAAWERLAEYELLVPAAIGGGGGREFGAGRRMWKVDVGLEEITGNVEAMSGVMVKWCSEI